MREKIRRLQFIKLLQRKCKPHLNNDEVQAGFDRIKKKFLQIIVDNHTIIVENFGTFAQCQGLDQKPTLKFVPNSKFKELMEDRRKILSKKNP